MARVDDFLAPSHISLMALLHAVAIDFQRYAPHSTPQAAAAFIYRQVAGHESFSCWHLRAFRRRGDSEVRFFKRAASDAVAITIANYRQTAQLAGVSASMILISGRQHDRQRAAAHDSASTKRSGISAGVFSSRCALTTITPLGQARPA